MKFDVIIGNPPYHKPLDVQQGQGTTVADDGTDNSTAAEDKTGSATMLYHKFIDRARLFRPRFISFVVRGRWLYSSSKGMAEYWRKQFLQSRNFRYLVNYVDSKNCFPELDIKGGVCFFLFDTTYDTARDGKLRVEHYQANLLKLEPEVTYMEHLDPYKKGVAVFESFKHQAIECIVRKRGKYYSGDSGDSLEKLVCPKSFYQQGNMFTTNWKGYEVSETSEAKVRYFVNTKERVHEKKLKDRPHGYVKRDKVTKQQDTLDLHKVIFPEAAGTGIDDLILGEPLLAPAPSCFSATYVCIGANPHRPYTLAECENIIKFLQTKFLRYLVSIKKNTQHGPRSAFTFVPQEDFSANSDIDWSQSVANIDRQLYDKYEFSAELRAEIERRVRYRDNIT